MLKIDQAFTSSFIAGNFGLPIAHENAEYEPVLGVPYAEIKVLQNDSTMYDTDETNETDGVFRVILRYPENTYTITAKTKAEEILAFYSLGSTKSYDTVDIHIRSASRQEGVPEAGWYKLVLTINYKSFLRR